MSRAHREDGMEQSKHTEGPWVVSKGAYLEGIGQQCDVVSRNKVICEYVLEPNARLIAAAPELLAALQSVLDRCSGIFGTDQETGDTFDTIIRAAIAKAEQS